MLYGEGWKVALIGTGTTVKGKVIILCDDSNDIHDIIDSFICAVGEKTNNFRIELHRVALCNDDELSGEMREI